MQVKDVSYLNQFEYQRYQITYQEKAKRKKKANLPNHTFFNLTLRSQTLANIHEIFQNIYPIDLLEHFKFLNGSRVICLPLNTSEKLHCQYLFEKLGKAETQELLNNNKDHSRKREPPAFFHSDTNVVLGHVLVHSVGKSHVLSVTVELT